jgi:hypothetical protein
MLVILKCRQLEQRYAAIRHSVSQPPFKIPGTPESHQPAVYLVVINQGD